MAANKVGRRYNNKHSPSRGPARDAGLSVQKRQARVTVKYNRKELQKRLDVEIWIDTKLDELYSGRDDGMPEEVNIDELLDLQSDEERSKRLQDLLCNCSKNTDAFIKDLVLKLHGLQKQEDLHNDGIEHPQLHIFSNPRTSSDSELQ